DQLKVTGTVNLSNATLQVTALSCFSATNVTQFTIIDNDSSDPIVGNFAFLPEGGLVDAGNGVVLRVSYIGGTGNDVVLTTVTTGVTRFWTGGGANNFWGTAGNWSNSIAPQAGDSLIFPSNATLRLATTNNFTAGTAFGSIQVGRNAFSWNGAGIVLHGGLSFDYTNGLTTFALPLTLALPQTFSITGGGSALLVGTVAIGSNAFSLAVQTSTLTLAGAISGSASLTKTGDGVLVLNASNTFSGTLTVA